MTAEIECNATDADLTALIGLLLQELSVRLLRNHNRAPVSLARLAGLQAITITSCPARTDVQQYQASKGGQYALQADFPYCVIGVALRCVALREAQ